jgi:protein-S-isoprenylcysteine O-methyltransferase Ste14
VTTPGRRWSTLVIVLPEAPLVRRGPFRWLHHPNYVPVVAEGLAQNLTPVPPAMGNAASLRPLKCDDSGVSVRQI